MLVQVVGERPGPAPWWARYEQGFYT
jgi:hypothetical protein